MFMQVLWYLRDKWFEIKSPKFPSQPHHWLVGLPFTSHFLSLSSLSSEWMVWTRGVNANLWFYISACLCKGSGIHKGTKHCCMPWDKRSDLVLWEDLEGAGGERGGSGDRDGEDMWTQGLFISMYDKIHYKKKKISISDISELCFHICADVLIIDEVWDS